MATAKSHQIESIVFSADLVTASQLRAAGAAPSVARSIVRHARHRAFATTAIALLYADRPTKAARKFVDVLLRSSFRVREEFLAYLDAGSPASPEVR